MKYCLEIELPEGATSQEIGEIVERAARLAVHHIRESMPLGVDEAQEIRVDVSPFNIIADLYRPE